MACPFSQKFDASFGNVLCDDKRKICSEIVHHKHNTYSMVEVKALFFCTVFLSAY